jgi:hypothetical protein
VPAGRRHSVVIVSKTEPGAFSNDPAKPRAGVLQWLGMG